MDQPRDLVRVPDEVGRKLRGDHQIDRPAVAFAQIEQPPRRGVRQDFFLRVPLERDADELGLVAARAQLPHELANVDLGAAVHERHLRFADEHSLERPFGRSGRRISRRVAEVDHVAVEDDVLLAFEPELAMVAARRQRAARRAGARSGRLRRG